MTKPKPKLAHVATGAGVSIGTASDALRNKGRMNATTRKRVKEVAAQLGYKANANARILALGQTRIVALVIRQPAGPDRIYWPRLQAAFTEELVNQGIVACTMSLDDLHLLAGLPFDLIVYADITSSEPIPPEIASAYDVLAVSNIETLSVSRALRELCIGVMNELTEHGHRRPGLWLAGPTDGPMTGLEVAYESWCRQKGLTPIVIRQADNDPGLASTLAALSEQGLDSLFAFMVDPTDLAVAQSSGHFPDSGIWVLPKSATDTPVPGLSYVSVDGARIGKELADLVIANINGSKVTAPKVAWLRNGQPWAPKK